MIKTEMVSLSHLPKTIVLPTAMASGHHKVLPSSKVFSNPVQVIADCKEVDRVVRVLLLEVVHGLLVERLAGHPLAKDLLAELPSFTTFKRNGLSLSVLFRTGKSLDKADATP